MRAPCHRPITLLLTLAVGLGGPAVAAGSKTPAKPPRGAELRGVVRGVSGEPLDGVRVVLTPMEGAGETSSVSTTTDREGAYKALHLPHGLYQIAFERAGQAFVGDRLMVLGPKTKTTANFRLTPFEPSDALAGLAPGVKAPGLDAAATGVAHLEERLGPTGLARLRTGKGVALLVGGCALFVAGLIAFGK